MESPGKYLKAERESQNLSLKEVSESTKIREPLLRALEEDQYELISSPVYVRGFLDAYARYLGLDSNNIILQYQENYQNKTLSKGPGVKQRETSSSLERWITFSKERVTRWHLIIAISVAVLLIAIVIYRISLKSRHGSLSLSEEGSELTSMSPVPSPPPVQKEAETLTTNPSPEWSQTTRSIGANTNNDIPSESFEVIEAGLGSGIERKDDFLTLKGRRSEFLCNNQKVYFVTKIKGKKEGKVFHVWFLNGKEFQRREIKIRPTEWTVYSILTLRAGDVGDWRVEVQHGNKVLKSLSFKGIEPASHPAHRRQ
jgi:cytoskeletal protein RodZ